MSNLLGIVISLLEDYFSIPPHWIPFMWCHLGSNFNNTAKNWYKFRFWFHHLPDGMNQIPGTFLRNTDPFAQIDRRSELAL
jgi:hypothetical protein